MPYFPSSPWDFSLGTVPECYERMPFGGKFTSVAQIESEIVSNFSAADDSKYLPTVGMGESDVIWSPRIDLMTW